MAIKSIITLPDEKILRQKSAALKSVDEAARRLFDDMLETMYDAPGIGLAAMWNPNGYGGADPAHAPFTQFDAAGQATGGLGQMRFFQANLSLRCCCLPQWLGCGAIAWAAGNTGGA